MKWSVGIQYFWIPDPRLLLLCDGQIHYTMSGMLLWMK